MATIVYLKNRIDHFEFRLSNKPEYLFLCDIEDLKILKSGSYYVHVSTKYKKPYIRKAVYPEGNHVHFHREIMSVGAFTKDCIIDHRDRNTLDCRKSNLRITDYSGNNSNRGDFNKSTSAVENEFFEVAGKRIRLNKVVRKLKGGIKQYFQAYYKQEYLGSSLTKETLKQKVINHYQGKENESEKAIERGIGQ